MKSSAITIFSVTAALALGTAAAMGGCTVTSTTGNDFDGGRNTSSSSSSSSSGGGSDAGDGGGDGGGGASTCEGSQQSVFFPETCQACLDTKCCDALKACYQLPAGAGGEIDCNAYTECIDTCNQGDPNELENCYDLCDGSAAAGVLEAYTGLVDQCALSNCSAECGL